MLGCVRGTHAHGAGPPPLSAVELMIYFFTSTPSYKVARRCVRTKKAGRSVKPKRTDLRITANVDSILLMILLIHVRYPLLSWLAS